MQNPFITELVSRLDNHREAFEERAGILEFDAGYPRDHADCLALLYVLERYPEAVRQVFLRE